MSPSRLRRSQRRERRTAARVATQPNLCDTLLAVWRHARWVFLQFCDFHAAPRALAEREWIATHEYRKIEAWLRAIELLTRRLVLAAALGLNIVREAADPARACTTAPSAAACSSGCINLRHGSRASASSRKSRRKCASSITTRATFRASCASFPLARRLEAVRRVLADPDQRIHRLAMKLARIRASNAKANSPRLFAARDWDSRKAITRDKRIICTGMELVMPLVHNRLDAFNQACEPG